MLCAACCAGREEVTCCVLLRASLFWWGAGAALQWPAAAGRIDPCHRRRHAGLTPSRLQCIICLNEMNSYLVTMHSHLVPDHAG